MRAGISCLVIVTMPFYATGCGETVLKKVNSDRQFEATYLKSETSQLGSVTSERIELKTKDHKFSAATYVHERLVRKMVFDGERLWEFTPKRHRSGRDSVIYREASHGDLEDRLYFWRMPSFRGLPAPTETSAGGRSYYSYQYSDFGPSGRVEVTILVDREQHFIKNMNSKFFMKTFGEGPFMEWDLDCRRIDFRDDIPDSSFSFTPPPGAEVKTAREAAREGLEAFKGLLQGP